MSVFDYRSKMYQVLLQPDVFMGIGIAPALTIMVVTIVLVNMVSIWMFAFGAGLFLIARRLCKNDPYMLEIIFERLLIADRYTS